MAANWTNTQVLDQLVSGSSWSSSNITYAFPTSSAGMYSNGESATFLAVSASQKATFVQALQVWDDLIAPTFALTTGASDIEFAFSTTDTTYAHGYMPNAGSAWFNSNSDLTAPTIGKYAFTTYIHEIGHTLGLNHMGNYDGAGTFTPSSFQDSRVLSIMSYFGPGGGQPSTEVMTADWNTGGVTYSPQTPMLNDVMAIQQIYGASTTTRTDNTVYGFSSTLAGSAIYDFTVNKGPILTIFDSGGIDTLNLSGWNTPATISLEAGTYSSCDDMTNNIAIAYNCVIENAVGGGGDDIITGNSAANRLEGGSGSDQLNGGAGNDVLVGGAGNDVLSGGDGQDIAVFEGTYASYAISYNAATSTFSVSGGSSGADSVSGVETFQFADLTKMAAQILDTAPPSLQTLSPVDNAVNVLPSANLVLGFSEAVQAGSGNIVIYNANGSIARSIAVTDTSQVFIAGSTVTINPASDLVGGSAYYVGMAAGVLTDLAGNNYAGIADTTTYNFTTGAAAASSAVKAIVHMGLADSFTIGSNSVTLYGSLGSDVVTIAAGASNVDLDQAIERVNLPGASSNYTFLQTGNIMNVYDATGSTLLVKLPVQGGAGTVFSFSNGTASAVISLPLAISLGGVKVSDSAPTALAPTLVAGAPAAEGLTKAVVYLGDGGFTVGSSGSTVYGTTGSNDTVTLAAGVSAVTLDQGTEQVQFAAASSNYTFKQTGNIINVYDAAGSTLLVKMPVQGDADGTLFTFTNGTASATIKPGFIMSLGAATVSASAATALTVFAGAGIAAAHQDIAAQQYGVADAGVAIDGQAITVSLTGVPGDHAASLQALL
ncbi:MAG: M10 family metallopeptidase C-terminal domain-containing protein [Pseudomonadota bacterium]